MNSGFEVNGVDVASCPPLTLATKAYIKSASQPIGLRDTLDSRTPVDFDMVVDRGLYGLGHWLH